jgi:hypothetical protein
MFVMSDLEFVNKVKHYHNPKALCILHKKCHCLGGQDTDPAFGLKPDPDPVFAIRKKMMIFTFFFLFYLNFYNFFYLETKETYRTEQWQYLIS